jgi:hypothetical protein
LDVSIDIPESYMYNEKMIPLYKKFILSKFDNVHFMKENNDLYQQSIVITEPRLMIDYKDFYEALNSNKRFIVIFVSLMGGVVGHRITRTHQNVIIVDKFYKRYFLFDPYGSSDSRHRRARMLINNIMRGYEELFTSYEYSDGMQTMYEEWSDEVEQKILKKNSRVEGFCISWCFFFVYLQLKYPYISSEKLPDIIINYAQSHELHLGEYMLKLITIASAQ